MTRAGPPPGPAARTPRWSSMSSACCTTHQPCWRGWPAAGRASTAARWPWACSAGSAPRRPGWPPTMCAATSRRGCVFSGAGLALEWLRRRDAVRDILASNGRSAVQGALAWNLARGPHTIPIPGCRTAAQAGENAATLHAAPLTAAELAEIDALLGRRAGHGLPGPLERAGDRRRGRRPAGPVLLVGHGVIGRALRATLAPGGPALTVTRRPSGPHACDLASEAGRAALRGLLRRARPRVVLLTHGPSDVTWIDENEAVAAAAHGGVAELAARAGVPVPSWYRPTTYSPARAGVTTRTIRSSLRNGYGRVKALAEQRAAGERAGSGAPGEPDLRLGRSRAAGHVRRALSGRRPGWPAAARPDRSAVHPDPRERRCTVLAAVAPPGRCRPASGIWPARPAQPVRVRPAGLRSGRRDQELVSPALRRDTEWACRPQFSSLACGTFADCAWSGGVATADTTTGLAGDAGGAGRGHPARPPG